MEVFTIGFTHKTAAQFFDALKQTGIRRLVDVRLNNSSQLAAFTKRNDLPYFLSEICDAQYVHQPLFAPTQEILDAYKKQKGSWQEYEARFLNLLAERRIEQRIDPALFDVPSVLLCSEPAAQCCHRRLVLEYLQNRWGGLEIVHL